jgi:hypothetical protein
MNLIYRLLLEFRLFRKLDHLWYVHRLKLRWRRTYSEATPINGVANLFISGCDQSCRLELAASFVRVWSAIPIESKRVLEQSWEHLQRRWDNRNTAISLHLPVVLALSEYRATYAGDLGSLIGLASISALRNGIEVSPDADMAFFARLFLPIWNSPEDCSAEELDLGTARSIASYLLWLNSPAPKGIPIGKFHSLHDDTDELIKKWGFVTLLQTEQANL